jgi:putative hydrolase of HD superfamily
MHEKIFEELIEFSRLIGKLKKIERTGWVNWVNVEDPESVADHVFRTAILGMMIADIKKLDTEKIVRMILLHDISESLMGDWDYFAKKKLGNDRFKQREKEVVEKILPMIPEELREKYSEILKELIEEKTEESRLIKQIDRLEMLFQALEYEKEGYDKKRLERFWTHKKEIFVDPDLKKIFDLLKQKRE